MFRTSASRVALLKNSKLDRSRFNSSNSSSTALQFKVVLDNQTLYVGKPLAEALGWTPQAGVDGVKLSLHGWDPTFFTITRAGTDSEWLARGTVESGQNPDVQTVLDHLKER
ncbi:hypothetical protein DFH11DRAFT_1583597 [Phellopilus nigrolimitatus]|nr:hypothetical protein DFH11DRAFT_1583597 [Phellopilus nigrolimitatus]